MQRNLAPGDNLGRYELAFPAGEGGMGQVWAAKLRGSQGFRKLVAVKTLLAREAGSSEMQRMLRDEAMMASNIRSPHVAETLDFGVHAGMPYLVMEWVDGESLATLLEATATPLPLRAVVAIVTQTCKGLTAAHSACGTDGKPLGLVHRDVSPPNILICYAGTVKLADFGIAKPSESKPDEGLRGKFAFMSPEQVQGGPIDARTDIFALSVLLYRLVTNRYPFAGRDPGETLWQISSSLTPRSPRALNDALPPRFEDIILKGLQKDPNDRFQSAEELRTAIERALPPTLRGNGEDVIANLMKEVLGERHSRRHQATVRALLSAPPGPIDQAKTPTFSTLKGLAVSAPPGSIATVTASPSARMNPAFRRRTRRVTLFGLGATVAVLATWAIAMSTGHSELERVPAGRSEDGTAHLPEHAEPQDQSKQRHPPPVDSPHRQQTLAPAPTPSTSVTGKVSATARTSADRASGPPAARPLGTATDAAAPKVSRKARTVSTPAAKAPAPATQATNARPPPDDLKAPY